MCESSGVVCKTVGSQRREVTTPRALAGPSVAVGGTLGQRQINVSRLENKCPKLGI